MNGQNNQTEQNTNTNQSQQSTQNQPPQNGGFPGLFLPINFIFRERARPSGENNSQNNGTQQSQQPQQFQEGQGGQGGQHIPQVQFFIYPIPGGDGQTTPGVFLFTPFFFPPPQVHKGAPESALKKLPIVTITKEHVDSQASCPICLEPFSLSVEQKESQKECVRKMPCNHMFCESCLFQWLRQNNSCPLCRKEIEETETQQNNNNESTTNAPPNVSIFGMMNVGNPPTPPSETANVAQQNSHTHNSHNSHSRSRSRSSCALANVGCCEETESNTATPIITLPQCHHRFHASCLRTSLLVEGFSPRDFNSIPHPLNFHCPTCRSPAIVQSSMFKIPTAPHDEQQQEQRVLPFDLPITIHVPESDDMDLD